MDNVTIEMFKSKMLVNALETSKILLEVSQNGGLEQEQVRKNAATILTILTETEDFLNTFNAVQKNDCSSS